MKIKRPVSKQPLPKNAKKVFDGVIFDVYHWKQKMFDGSFETFEKIKRLDTVVVIPVLDDGRIVLTKQSQPGRKGFVIGGAGGRIDRGEKVLDAAKRELLEETGYEAKKLIFWKSIQPVSKIEWAVYYFIARDLKKVSGLHLDSGEKIELLKVTFDEFLKIAMKKNFYEEDIYRDVVEAVLDKKKKQKLRKLLLGK